MLREVTNLKYTIINKVIVLQFKNKKTAKQFLKDLKQEQQFTYTRIMKYFRLEKGL